MFKMALASFIVLSAFFMSANLSSATEIDTDSASNSAIRERLETASDEKFGRLEEIRLETQRRFEEKRREFRERLKGVREERRKSVLGRLVDKFGTVNDKWVDHWKKILEALSRILDKIDARAQQLASEGVDISDYEGASAEARAKITAAAAELEEQAGNTYVFEATTEAQFGQQVKSLTVSFKADVQATHKLVKDAREAVHKALSVLKGLKDEEK